jgi:hypothetical protein
MLKILPVSITDQYHLMEEFSIWSGFGPNFPNYEEKLLDGVIVGREGEPNDGHEKAREFVTINDHEDDGLEGLSLNLVVPMLQIVL